MLCNTLINAYGLWFTHFDFNETLSRIVKAILIKIHHISLYSAQAWANFSGPCVRAYSAEFIELFRRMVLFKWKDFHGFDFLGPWCPNSQGSITHICWPPKARIRLSAIFIFHWASLQQRAQFSSLPKPTYFNHFTHIQARCKKGHGIAQTSRDSIIWFFFLKQNGGELIELIHKKLNASNWSLSHPFAGYSPEQQGPCRPVAQDGQAQGNLYLEAWQFYSGKKECFYNYYVKCSSVSRFGYEIRHSHLRYEENIPFPNRDLTWNKNIK